MTRIITGSYPRALKVGAGASENMNEFIRAVFTDICDTAPPVVAAEVGAVTTPHLLRSGEHANGEQVNGEQHSGEIAYCSGVVAGLS